MAKTISEIAEETGYSRTTITMVLSGRASEYRISTRTQKIIRDYVDEHGYTINQTARNLKTQRSHTIGFVAPEIANPFFARFMAHLEACCRSEGLVLITTSSGEDPLVEARALQSLLERGVDALVLAPCAPRPAVSAKKRSRQTPMVVIDRHYPGDNTQVIASDHRENARLLTAAVMSAGASDMVFFCGHPENPAIVARIAGFRAAAGEGENARLLTAADDSVAAGKAMMQTLLEAGGALPSALLCSSLLVLEGALQHFRRTRSVVPPDMIIATFDYDGFLELLPNTVIVIRQDEEALARAAFQALSDRIGGNVAAEGTRTVVDAELLYLNAPA
ncbi:substrate-binding domain-containing protein [uncultured Martelella sp.]|uniref:substrate-binding domain-containing protein n=1 Tax=uncultured Martelella sp. TaxID=392331 RepID=UPI0029C8A4DF|nr:substrate-binding domain-containing protein [uncultured Martelella sp.]